MVLYGVLGEGEKRKDGRGRWRMAAKEKGRRDLGSEMMKNGIGASSFEQREFYFGRAACNLHPTNVKGSNFSDASTQTLTEDLA